MKANGLTYAGLCNAWPGGITNGVYEGWRPEQTTEYLAEFDWLREEWQFSSDLREKYPMFWQMIEEHGG